MTVTAGTTLPSVLAAWLESEGIAEGDLAAEVASSLLENSTMTYLAGVLSVTGEAPRMLRDAAIAVAEIAGADRDEWAAEAYWHGHEDKPRTRRKRAPMTTEGEAA